MTSVAMNMSASPTLTVTQVGEYVKRLLESDRVMSSVYVSGEISNFTNHRSGHLYFTLKDEGSAIAAVMFRSAAAKLRFMPENGMKVVAHGRISSFVKSGQYQIYAESLEPDGVGSLYVAYEQLKRRLEAEGLFSPARKKPIPKIPTRVGVITSPTGAAVRDIINITGRRFPLAKVVIYPALVQGKDAPAELINGVRYFNQTHSVDVIILGRGGGSIEDLWAFNDEALARCVADSEIPILSAVGHETDFTVCDFAADMRASTPSAAAELAVPDRAELKRKIGNIVTHMENALTRQIRADRDRLTSFSRSRVMTSPQNFIDDKRVLLMSLANETESKMTVAVGRKREKFVSLTASMEALNPMAVISRGYAAVFDGEKRVIKSVGQVRQGDRVTLCLSDGRIVGEVKEIQEKK